MMHSAAEAGEPWVGFFEPATLAADLRRLGFEEVDDLDLAALRRRYLGEATVTSGDAGPHVALARRS